MLPNGLVATHVYSIIQVRTVDKFQLLELRNPWGHGAEWNGRWGDNDSSWREYPKVKEELKHQDADDGTFWMSFDDFAKEYTSVYMCPISGAKVRDSLKSAMSTKSSHKVASPACKVLPQRKVSFELEKSSFNVTTGNDVSSSSRSSVNGGSCADRCSTCSLM